MTPAIVTLDIGTTSVRAIGFDADGRALHLAARANPPTPYADGRVEQDPGSWPAAATAVLREVALALAARGATPAGIAVTAQRSSLIAVDAAGLPLHPAILWQDTRSAALAEAMAAEQAAVYQRSGLRISPVFTAVKALWLKRERPALWARAHKLLGVQDHVLHALIGRWVTDESLANRTNLFNLHRRAWDDELLALFEVPRDKLCELIPVGAVAGGLTPQAAAACALPAGLPVVAAGGDQQCAALGQGLLGPGQAVANTGTGSYLLAHADEPVLDPLMRVSCNVAAVPGAYIVEAATLASGAALRWLMALLGLDPDAPADLARIEAWAAAVDPGRHGLLWLPHFRGAGSPHWDPSARASLHGLSLATTRGEIARALLEAIAIELKEGLEPIEALVGAVEAVHVAGGMTRSALFNRIQADVLERPVLRHAGDESTSEGAWMAGCVALGLASSHAAAHATLARRAPPTVHDPDAAQAGAYRRQRCRMRAVYDALAAPAVRGEPE